MRGTGRSLERRAILRPGAGNPGKRLLNAADSSTKSTSSTRSFSAFRRAKRPTLTRSSVCSSRRHGKRSRTPALYSTLKKAVTSLFSLAFRTMIIRQSRALLSTISVLAPYRHRQRALIAANRISYCLNLRGPSVAMDTACSSALTAIHTACEHIWAGRGDTALAGGVTVMITPGGFIGFSQASMLSPEGRCAAFEATANGFVRGEGAGMVLLKRLSQAHADGDPVLGVIAAHRSTRTDTPTASHFQVPRPRLGWSWMRAKTRRFARANRLRRGARHRYGGWRPDRSPRPRGGSVKDGSSPLPIGSFKTNLGHLETAAGMAGLLKAMLVLQHRVIPGEPAFHFPESAHRFR